MTTGYLTAPPVACPGTVASHNPAPSQGRADIAQYVVQPPSGVARPENEMAPFVAPVVRIAPAICSRCHGTGSEPEEPANPAERGSFELGEESFPKPL